MAKNRKVLDLSDLFTKGKHQGKTVKEVCLEEPNYIHKVYGDNIYEFTNSVWYYLEDIY